MIEITLTETAKIKLLKVLENYSSKSIRLIQQGFGWIGPVLGMVLDEHREGDETVHLKGINFVYDRRNEDLLNQTVIDFKDSWVGQRFEVCSPASEPC